MTTTKVLIADDSPLMRSSLTTIFEKNNIEVIGEAKDGEEAVKLFEEHRPNIMTLDIEMPNKKGTEVLEELITKYPDATIIMVSSISDAKVVMHCLKTGAKRYILKPFDEDTVMRTINKVINTKKLTKTSPG